MLASLLGTNTEIEIYTLKRALDAEEGVQDFLQSNCGRVEFQRAAAERQGVHHETGQLRLKGRA